MIRNKLYYHKLGEFFKDQRTSPARDYSLSYVASHIAIPTRTYYDYERGTRKMPIDVLSSLCSLYGLDINVVFKMMLPFLEKFGGSPDSNKS